MKRPKVITFDAGHTLVYANFNEFNRLAKKYYGQSFTTDQLKEAELRIRYGKTNGKNTVLKGLPLPGVTTFFSGGLICELVPDCASDTVTLLRFLKACEPVQDSWFKTLGPGVIPCLEALHAKGFRLWVLSNANGTVEQNIEDAGIRAYFNHVIDSGLVGFEKPDARIFQYVFELARIQPDELMHIGDSLQADVHGAMNAGAQAALFDPDFRVPPGTLPSHVPHFRSLRAFADSFCPAE
ncbi:MAG: HAD family hydrolase [Patescibacteria group bacterium]